MRQSQSLHLCRFKLYILKRKITSLLDNQGYPTYDQVIIGKSVRIAK